MKLKNLLMLLLSVLLVVGVVLAGGCAGNQTATQETPAQVTQVIEDVTPQEAFTLIQDNRNNPDFVIIDVRTPEEFADGHIENATMIDFYSVTFRSEIDSLDKDKNYLIYCRSGGRSGQARDIMEELGFQEVHNIAGGMIDWNAEGLPTVK